MLSNDNINSHMDGGGDRDKYKYCWLYCHMTGTSC